MHVIGIFSSIAGIVGAAGKKKAVGKAADAQVAAAQQGIDAITANNATTQANFQPYIGAGASALGAQQDLLGLGGDTGGPNWDAYLQQNPDVAAYAQQAVAQGIFKTPQEAAQSHYTQYGQGEGRTLPGATGQTGADAQQASIDQLKASPLFQSLFNTGQEAVLQNASATGGLRGGNVQNSLATFGSDTLAKVIQQQLSNLGGLSGQGLQAVGQAGQLGANATGSIASLFGDQGQARAGGIIGKANANTDMYNSIAQGAGQIAGAFMPATGAARAGGGSGGGILSTLAKLF